MGRKKPKIDQLVFLDDDDYPPHRGAATYREELAAVANGPCPLCSEAMVEFVCKDCGSLDGNAGNYWAAPRSSNG